MGLTSWRKAPKGKIMPSDVVIAKNYLDKNELKELDRIGNMYLDFAEIQTSRGKIMKMKDWKEKLDAFLKFSEYEVDGVIVGCTVLPTLIQPEHLKTPLFDTTEIHTDAALEYALK